MRETKDLEFKGSISNTFLKTVCAFANVNGGKILFGIADDGTVKGIDNPQECCLEIENKIKDSFKPIPEYSLAIDAKTNVITLCVKEGIGKPYLYKAKSYKRNDSATVELDPLELKRLIMAGMNLTFEELPSAIQEPKFSYLDEKLKNELDLSLINIETLKTLELYHKDEGYNQAALLLSDNNTFCGIDIAKFGESISINKERNTIEKESSLKQFDDAMVMFKRYYQYEEIKTAYRKTVELLPENAFREALVNAIIHRAWDVKACINVAMFEDRIEITSPGGLPRGLDESEYLKGGVSILRNRILGSVFYRLHLIEHFGSGVKRIMDEYIGNMTKPQFFCSENAVKVILPVLKQDNLLTPDENSVYTLVKKGYASSTDITKNCPFGKNKVVNILKILVTQGYIRQTGNGRGTRYSL